MVLPVLRGDHSRRLSQETARDSGYRACFDHGRLLLTADHVEVPFPHGGEGARMSDEFMKRLAAEVANLFPVTEGETFEQYVARARQEPAIRRTLIAGSFGVVQKQMRAERQVVKRTWISAARLSFDPGPRQSCHICGKFRYVAQAHHVIPLHKQFDRGFKEPDQEHAWLCPSHHAIIHVLIDQNITLLERASLIVEDLDLEIQQSEKVNDLLLRSQRGPT